MDCKTFEFKNLKPALASRLDLELLENILYAHEHFADHGEIFGGLKNCQPCMVTIIIESLKPEYYSKKKYTEKIVVPIQSKYRELLFRYFFDEFGDREGNDLYAEFLKKYRKVVKSGGDIDEYIIERELDTRYRERILKRYKNIEKLMAPRVHVDRKRYYNLPHPLDRIDWRNPYDNIFIWNQDGKKFCTRGGSGSSGQREINSKFIYGFSLINKIKPIPSYLFIYSDENELIFIKKFSHLTVPRYDIGSNYHLLHKESEEILSGVDLLEWRDVFKVKTLKICGAK